MHSKRNNKGVAMNERNVQSHGIVRMATMKIPIYVHVNDLIVAVHE
jgi:hypothetical protein